MISENDPLVAVDQPVAERDFDLSAGALPLDFANTLDDRNDPLPREELADYTDLLRFAQATETIDAGAVARLAAVAARDPDAATAARARAIALREALYRIFSAIAAGRSPADSDLAVLNRALADALPHGRVVRADDAPGECVWAWEEGEALDRPLWPIARAAADLLLSDPVVLRRLRECAADDCGWLFLDTTRNRSRRWCSMETCGNRAKVQQFRERKRGVREQGSNE